MKRVRKPLPVSLRRAIIARNRNHRGHLKFVACTKAVMIGNPRNGGYLGSAYYDGNEFYFSRQLLNNLLKYGYNEYFELKKDATYFLEACLSVHKQF